MTRVMVRAVRQAMAAALFLFASLTGLSAETRHALLVGVRDYHPSVAAFAPPLSGPGNDVALMWQVLREAKIPADRITVLTDVPSALPGIVKTGEPTRAAILSALDSIGETVSNGDDVLLYFAGHGGQLPDRGGDGTTDEPDGLDEVFLPADFSIDATGDVPHYANEIRDDEIGARIDRMIDRGAHVWLVADTCHAGTLQRGDPGNLVPRQLTLWHGDDRGLDKTAVLAPPRGTAGQFVAFYGARAGALAYETRVPDADGGPGRTHGLLTWSLAQSIREGARDYQALARTAGARIWSASAGRASPDFVGALGGSPMLGADRQAGDRYRLIASDDGLYVTGGLLDGLTEDDMIHIGWHDAPRAQPLLATARVAAAGLAVARVDIPAAGHPDAAALDQMITEEGLDPVAHRQRWLQGRAPALVAWQERGVETSFELRFGAGLAGGSMARGAIQTLLSGDAEGTEKPPIEIDLMDGALTLRHAQLATPVSMPATPDGVQALRAQVDQLQHARRLRTVGLGLAGRGLSPALETTVTIRPSGAADCKDAPELAARTESVVHHCDLVEIDVRNTGVQALDVTPLYLAPDGQVFFLSGYDGSNRGGLRLRPNTRKSVRFREDTAPKNGVPAATGQVTLLLFAVEAQDDGRPPVDFRYLQSVGTEPVLRAAVIRPDRKISTKAGAAVLTLTTQPPQNRGRVAD